MVIVGRGRLGTTLAGALAAADIEQSLLPGRGDFNGAIDPSSAVVFLAVPDGAVAATATRVAEAVGDSGTPVAHLSGALELSALAAATATGLPVGSFHPLQPFAAVRPPDVFDGTTIGVESDSPSLLLLLETLALRIGGQPRRIPDSKRALYHAAAAIASAHVVGLAAQASAILEQLGWDHDEAITSLLPLIDGAVANLRSEGVPDALSGPTRRGDAGALERHVEALTGFADGTILASYRLLGHTCVQLARGTGVDEDSCRRMDAALETSSPTR